MVTKYSLKFSAITVDHWLFDLQYSREKGKMKKDCKLNTGQDAFKYS